MNNLAMRRSNAESLWNVSNYELPVDRYVSGHDRTSASRDVGGICAGLREVDEQVWLVIFSTVNRASLTVRRIASNPQQTHHPG